jgi:hypothetical protein
MRLATVAVRDAKTITPLAALALLAITMLGTVRADAAQSHRSCNVRAGHVVVHSRQGAVSVADGGFPFTNYYGCVYKLRHPFRLFQALDSSQLQTRVVQAWTTGHSAALWVETDNMDLQFPTYRILVYDLRNGHQIHGVAVDGVTVNALVLTTNGAAAWVTDSKVVRKVDAAGAETLDEGTTIDPHSLMLSNKTVTWHDSSGRKSARLR